MILRKNVWKRISFCLAVGFLVMGVFSSPLGIAEERKPDPDKKGRLTIPWDEFKRLLKLDEDEIVLSWESFQKILAQTQKKDIPPYMFKEGNVVLTQAEFKKLINQMIPPHRDELKPPYDYVITKAKYEGIMRKGNTSFKATFSVHVLKKDAFLKIPLLSQQLALEDVRINGASALVKTEGGYHYLNISSPGKYTVKVSFSVKSSLEKGPHKLDIPIPQTSITLLSLEIPLKNIDVEVPQAQQIISRIKGNSTIVSAIISQGSNITVKWIKKISAAEKLPAKLYAEVYHLVSIEDDALKINTDINFNVLHSEIEQVRFIIPNDVNILQVSGDGVGEWRDTEKKGERLLIVPLTYGKKGNFVVNLYLEKTITDGSTINSFSGLRVLDAVREIGFLGVELNTSAEVTIVDNENLEKIAVEKLPKKLFNKSVKPLIYGFKYLKHPYNLSLDIKKHEKISVPVATVDSANMVTLFTADGKIVHRLIYHVKNSGKQFLSLQLPEKTDVWSVFVNNAPVESSVNSQGKLLIPLIRSKSVNNRLNAFPVEIIYCTVNKKFIISGTKNAHLPQIDLLISQLMWSVYLPNDYKYLYFLTTLEKEEMIRGFSILSRSERRYNEKVKRNILQKRSRSDMPQSSVRGAEQDLSRQLRPEELEKIYRGKNYKSKFRNLEVDKAQEMVQLKSELDFGYRMSSVKEQPQKFLKSGGIGGAFASGVLPMHIKVPTGGQVYRFAKTIIKEDDPLTLKIYYTQNVLVKLFKWLIFIIIGWIVYKMRKGVKTILNKLINVTETVYIYLKEHCPSLNDVFKAKSTLIILFIVFIVIGRFSVKLQVLAFVSFIVLAVYQVVLFIVNKIKSKKEESPDNKE